MTPVDDSPDAPDAASKEHEKRRSLIAAVGGYMFSRKLSILRLRRYERECRDGRIDAAAPLTKRELTEIEQAFRRLAMELEDAERQLAEG